MVLANQYCSYKILTYGSPRKYIISLIFSVFLTFFSESVGPPPIAQVAAALCHWCLNLYDLSLVSMFRSLFQNWYIQKFFKWELSGAAMMDCLRNLLRGLKDWGWMDLALFWKAQWSINSFICLHLAIIDSEIIARELLDWNCLEFKLIIFWN